MTGRWSGSTRRDGLPADWWKIRRAILERDGRRCTHPLVDGRRCPAPATDVDHITPGSDHRPENLRSLCRVHHLAKSSAEGNAARWRYRDKREPERHPGLI